MRISIVINCDTRDGFESPQSSATKLFDGCKSKDFLVEGVKNKIKFFDGFDKEVIVFVDEHNSVPEAILLELKSITDTLIIRKHSKFFGSIESFGGFNDLNFLHALAAARGDLVAHFDADCAAFTVSPEPIREMIRLLDTHKLISYPSHWSPNAVTDPSFGGHTWASTRFFMCKRETLKFDILQKCLLDPDWAYATYGDKPRKCNWTEHFLAHTNNNSVFYPPINLKQTAVFCWNHYIAGTLHKLNSMPYSDVEKYIWQCGGIKYPADITAYQI